MEMAPSAATQRRAPLFNNERGRFLPLPQGRGLRADFVMTCQECELRLAEGEFGAGVEDHLLECADCHALARELRENSIALAAMQEDSVVEQALASSGGFDRRQRSRIWIPVAVAAALVLLALGLPRHRRDVPPPPVPVVAAVPAPTLAP